MITIDWSVDLDPIVQLRSLSATAAEPGLLAVTFSGSGADAPLPWSELEPWTRSRAVTVADVRGELAPPGLEVALCSDLVYLRVDSVLRLADRDQQPSAGLVWALSRAGRPALAAGLLDGGPMPASRAVALGLAQDLAEADQALPLPAHHGPAALTAARDLMRSRAGGEAGLALELATFRLLFAAGEPEEGALAFLERRQPSFGGSGEE